jgi:hypothetical protein
VATKEQPRRERQQEVASPYLPANLPNDYGVNVGNFSEFDTPTYLRRQMD